MANAIAENIFAQVNGEVNHHVLFEDIINHKYDGPEVKNQDAFITANTGTKRCSDTKNKVEVFFQWKDGSTKWVTLKDMNNSYPLQMTKYAVHRRIADDPVFAWWI